MRHTRERLDGMHFVLPSKTNAALKFSRRASPLSGYYFFEVPRSFASRRVACSFPPLPLHVQFSCLFNSQSRSFQSFYDPNVSSSLFSLLSSPSRVFHQQTPSSPISSVEHQSYLLVSPHMPATTYTEVLMI
jgi:hypothetical protein